MITVCITTQGRRTELERLLVAPAFIDAVMDHEAQVLILVQGCTDGTLDWLQDWASAYTFITVWPSIQRSSVAVARQRMVDRLKGAGMEQDDVVVFLDDDIIVREPSWLVALVDGGVKQADIMIAGANGRVITPQWQTVPADGPADYVGGGWMAVRGLAAMVLEWDFGFEACYWEDVDFCLQARSLGWDVLNLGDIGLEHPHSDAPLGRERAQQYERNRARCRQQWAGKGLIAFERVQR